MYQKTLKTMKTWTKLIFLKLRPGNIWNTWNVFGLECTRKHGKPGKPKQNQHYWSYDLEIFGIPGMCSVWSVPEKNENLDETNIFEATTWKYLERVKHFWRCEWIIVNTNVHNWKTQNTRNNILIPARDNWALKLCWTVFIKKDIRNMVSIMLHSIFYGLSFICQVRNMYFSWESTEKTKWRPDIVWNL